MVIWLIGLSGSGKSTLANKIVLEANELGNKTVLLDGDVIREIFGDDLGHSLEDRFKNAERICQLGKFLDNQGINVVTAILSLFPESREWNRNNIKNYYEVYIKTPLDDLIKRDSKGLYEKFNKGKISDVAGMDIEFIEPTNADIVIDNSDSIESFLNHAKPIVEKLIHSQ